MLEIINLSLKLVIVALTIVSTLLVFITPTKTSATEMGNFSSEANLPNIIINTTGNQIPTGYHWEYSPTVGNVWVKDAWVKDDSVAAVNTTNMTNMTVQFPEVNQTTEATQTTLPQQLSQSQSQFQQNRINWLGLCLNPLVDYVIIEDCYTLTTPDGYTLTSEGQRVLGCLAGGVLVGILAPEVLAQLRQVGSAVNCGGLGGSSSQ